MGRTTGTGRTLTAAPAEALSELHHGREVVWIFHHSGCIGIAGQGNGDALTRIGGLMVRVIHIANIGTETATVELDDSIVEMRYSGIADMLREAARLQKAERAAPCDVSLETHRRASGKFATASDAGHNHVLLAP